MPVTEYRLLHHVLQECFKLFPNSAEDIFFLFIYLSIYLSLCSCHFVFHFHDLLCMCLQNKNINIRKLTSPLCQPFLFFMCLALFTPLPFSSFLLLASLPPSLFVLCQMFL